MKIAALLAMLCVTPMCAALGGTSEVPTDCAAYVPFGQPVVEGQHPTTLACRVGYLSQVNGTTLQPDWVAWTLDAARAVGCVERTNPFHYDDKLPPGFKATPGDYAKTGFDLGHMSGYEDNAVSPEMGRDSFDVPTNFSPQVGGLNRQAWEEVEQDTRIWALQYGKVDIIDGPIFGPLPKTIGVHKVAVPVAFWKVIYIEAKHQAVTIIMDNVPIPKKHFASYVVSVTDAEKVSGVHVSLPSDVDRDHVVLPFAVDTGAFTKSKANTCSTYKKAAAP